MQREDSHARRGLRVAPTVLALLVCISAAWLRLYDLGTPGLWLDEILGVRSIGPEHGPLYDWVMRATTALGGSEALIRLPFAVAGVCSVWLIYRVGSVVSGPSVGLLAALILTASPLHIYYSREARPYALLIAVEIVGLLAIAQLAVLFASREREMPREGERRAIGWRLTLATSLIVLLLISANGLFYAAALLLAFAIVSIGSKRSRSILIELAFAAALAVVTAALFYVRYGSLVGGDHGWAVLPLPAVLGALTQPLISGHTESAPVTSAVSIGLALAAFGAVGLGWGRPAYSIACVATATAGLLLPVIALSSAGHWLNVRYVLASLPALVLQIAGIAAPLDLWRVRDRERTAQVGASARRRAALILTALVVGGGLIIGRVQSAAIARGLNDKADWRKVASIIRDRSRGGDLVVASNDWTAICLGYYLPATLGLTVASAKESIDTARALLQSRPLAFLVAGGYHKDPRIRSWMTDEHVELYANSREAIRVSFYPNQETYLTTRVTPAEIARDEQTLWSSLAGQLDLRTNSDRFLLDGWSGDAERDHRGTIFRWVVQPTARVYLPVATRRPAAFKVAILPFDGVREQTLAVFVNGEELQRLELKPGWNNLDVALTQAPFRVGGNVLEFRFAGIASPAARGLADGRSLAAAFQSMAFR